MVVLSSAFLGAWAAQIGSLSAFLGGFSATVLVTLLIANNLGRATQWAIVLTALSAVAFVVAAVATTTLVAGSHPDAPAAVARAAAQGPARAMAAVCFALGAYALLAAVGCAGWLRSRPLGFITTGLAILGGFAMTVIFAGL
jgi:hypothetical protein